MYKDIKFKAPRDIKEGEEFSFEELYSSDENVSRIEAAIKSIVDGKESVIRMEQEDILKNKIESFKTELNDRFEERKKELEELAKEKISVLVSAKESEIKAEKDVALNKAQMLEKTLAEYKELLEKIDSKYEAMLEEKILREREILTKEKDDLIKEYEDKAKSATTIGENAEEEIRTKLRDLYPEDIIEKPNHALGEADVLHKVVENNKEYAQIYYEIKNRKTWSKADYENFADKVRTGKHEFNIYIAQSLPKKQHEQHIVQFEDNLFFDQRNNIYLTSFENWLPVITVLRRQSILLKQAETNNESMKDIKDRVFEYFSSPDFKNYFQRLVKNFSEIEKVFKSIQKATIDGIAINNKAALEIENLDTEINSKLNI